MANPRAAVKQAHERAQVNLLTNMLNNRYGSSYEVILEPEPPEAIIKSNRTISWVEVVTAYLNNEFARDINSSVTEGETHHSISGTLIVGPDAQFCQNFTASVRAKLEKKTYEKFRDQYGPGYLVVSIQNPFFDDETLSMINQYWSSLQVADLGCFRSVYLTYRVTHGYRIRRWTPPTKLAISKR